MKEAVAGTEGSAGPRSVRLALALERLAEMQGDLGQVDAALSALKKALRTATGPMENWPVCLVSSTSRPPYWFASASMRAPRPAEALHVHLGEEPPECNEGVKTWRGSPLSFSRRGTTGGEG